MTKPTNIAPAITGLAVPIDAVEPHPANTYRQHDLGAIGRSLTKFGQLKPVVAQKRTDGPHLVVAGRGTLLAARQLGWTHIAAAVHELDDGQAMAFIAADNRTQQLGTDDPDALAALLKLLGDNDLLDGTGWDGDDVDALLAKVAAEDPAGPPAGADDTGIQAASQYAVAVLCTSEPHQREVFERLAAEGYAVKVLTV